MLKKLLSRKKKKKAPEGTLSTLLKLRETLEMLENKEHVLRKKLSIEVEKAKDFIKLKNKKGAIQCLKKKNIYEAQVEQLVNFQLRVQDQIVLLDGARATTDTIDALRTGASAVEKIHNTLNVDDIHISMEEVSENMENLKQIQEAISTPVGAAADLDEDELEAEFDELEELEVGELLELPSPISAPTPVPPSDEKAKRTKLPSDDDGDVEKLAKLQAEMTI